MSFVKEISEIQREEPRFAICDFKVIKLILQFCLLVVGVKINNPAQDCYNEGIMMRNLDGLTFRKIYVRLGNYSKKSFLNRLVYLPKFKNKLFLPIVIIKTDPSRPMILFLHYRFISYNFLNYV